MDRRKYLQSIGAGAISVPIGLGLSSGTGAVNNDFDGLVIENTSTEDVQEIFNSPKVEVLLQELITASPPTEPVPGGNYSAPRFDTEAAETVVASVPDSSKKSDSSSDLTVTSIPSDMGTMVYGEFEDGEDDAIFYLDDDATYLQKVRDGPNGSGMSALITDGTEPVFFREASGEEKEQLAKVVDASPDDIYASTNSKTNNFQVLVASARSASAQPEVATAYQVNLNGSGAQVERTGDPEFFGCTLQCTLCGIAYTPCEACVSLCFSGVGTAACIICLVHTCGVNAPSCLNCLDCLV